MASGGVAHGGDDPVRAWLRSNVPHVVRELFAGGAAGAIAKTCVAPLERTKILLMTGRSRTSALSTLRLILATEGVPGLFRGNGASCLRIMPYAAIHFSVYEAYRRILAEHMIASVAAPPPSLSAATISSGGCAAAAATAASGDMVDGGGGGERRAADPQAGVSASVSRPPPPPRLTSGALPTAAAQQQHLGEDVPPTPMTSSIDVSATAVITTVEEEQRVEALPAEALPPPPPPPAQWHRGAGSAQQERNQQQQRRRRPGPIVDLVAGSAAGATAVLLTYPLDMVRTRMAWAMDGGSRKSAALAAAAASPPPLAANVSPASSVVGTPLTSAVAVPAGISRNASTAAVPEAHGLAAAARQPPAHHIRIGAMLVHTARHEGIRGLYRGLAPTLYGIMPYAGLKFFVYGSLKQWYRETLQPLHPPQPALAPGAGAGGGGVSVSERLPVPYMLAFGGVSGLLAQTVTYPLDVVRRRMQVYGIQQEAAASAVSAAGQGAASSSSGASVAAAATASRLTTWDVGSTIVRQEGLRGLFRGLSLNYVKVVPSTAIGFTVYDMFKSYLGVMGNLT